MDSDSPDALEEIREIITALKAQADSTQAMRMTVPLDIINRLHNAWTDYERFDSN
jgi:hypothetical protein